MTSLLLAASLATPGADSRPAEAVAQLSVAPAAAPKPALKYQLLPEVRELKAGNPTQWYLRCFMEQRTFFFEKNVVAERARQRTMPLKDLPAQNLRNYGGHALTQADWGARLDTPDWQVLDRVQTEGADLRLAEITPLRELGIALHVRFRGEVARGDFDDAIRTAKTMFAFARHLGECPTLAANRLGISVAEMALDALTEMVQQPNCPNLYWALTDLPLPLVDLRKGAQGDRVGGDTELRALRDDAALLDTELDELVGRVSGRTGFAREQAGLPPRNVRADLAARAKDEAGVRAAGQRLIDAGLKKDTVASFAALQVILLDEKREFESRRDEQMKLLGLKLTEMDTAEKKPEADGLFTDLVPRVGETRRAQGRLEQRIALLRHVEALRMFAANSGKLPEKLDGLGVPLPADPFTGKPFGYALDGTTAKLTTAEVRFEVTLRK
jgi:hypothetical protein